MHENLYPIPESFAAAARIKRADYQSMYVESIEDPERFWGRIGRRIDWIKECSRVKEASFAEDDFHIRWFEGRETQCREQLSGPALGNARGQDGHHLGG